MSNEKTNRQPGTNPAEVTEIDLAELFKHVFKFWPLIILAALVGAALMGGTKYIKNIHIHHRRCSMCSQAQPR